LLRTYTKKHNLNLGNVAANIVARMSSICLNIAAVPILIKYLGLEAYGVIGFYNVVIALAALLEIGLPLAINRAVAQFSASKEDGIKISKIIKSFEIIIGLVATIIALSWMLCSTYISGSWLTSETNNSLNIESAVFLIGILVGFRFPIGLYTSVLGGMQKQVVMNLIIIVFSWSRICIPLLSVVIFDLSLVEFFQLQILVSIIELVTVRHVAWNSNSKFNSNAPFCLTSLIGEGKLAINIGFMSTISIMIGQLDRVMVSGWLDLETFGIYTVAAMFGLVLTTLGYPFSATVFPQFSQAFKNSNNEKIKNLFHSYMSMLTPCLYAVCIPLLLFTEDILDIYLVSEVIPGSMIQLTQLFLLSGMISGKLCLPYSIIIASGNLNPLIRYNLVSILIYPVVLYFLITKYGAIGAVLAYAVYQCVTYFSIIMICLKLLDIGSIYLILTRYFLVPITLCFAIIACINVVFNQITLPIVVELVLHAFLIFVSLIVVMFFNLSKTISNKA
jgi:O-antigen/teichoic acid export membrane protein